MEPAAGRGDGRRYAGLGWLLAAGAGVSAVFQLLPFVPGPGPVESDAFLGFALGLAPVVLLAWVVARRVAPWWALAAVLAVGLVGAVGLSAAGHVTAAVPFKVVFAAGVGRLLGEQVGEPLYLVIVAVVAVLADVWSVFAGPTKVVLEQAPVVLDYLLVHFPLLGAGGTGMGLGMSDVVFLALFAAGSARAGLRTGVGFAAMSLSLLGAVAAALLWKPALPALPFIGLAFLAANGDRLVSAARRRRARPPAG